MRCNGVVVLVEGSKVAEPAVTLFTDRTVVKRVLMRARAHFLVVGSLVLLACSGGPTMPSGVIETQGLLSLVVAGGCDLLRDDCDFIESCELLIDGRAVGRRVTHSPPYAACETLLSGYTLSPGRHTFGLRLIAHTRQQQEYELSLQLTAQNINTGEVKFIFRDGHKRILSAGSVMEYEVTL